MADIPEFQVEIVNKSKRQNILMAVFVIIACAAVGWQWYQLYLRDNALDALFTEYQIKYTALKACKEMTNSLSGELRKNNIPFPKPNTNTQPQRPLGVGDKI